MSRSALLKEEGNLHFKNGDYVSAEALYSKALIADPKNVSLHTNRAMARLKMNLWDSAISDCNDCLALSPDNMKAYYTLSQAHFGLNNYAEALEHARRAHGLCILSGDKSLSAITAQVLKCKKERWEELERHRRREGAELESEILEMMETERNGMLGGTADEGDRREISQEWEQKMSRMRRIFEMARAAEERRRAVPDWAIDDISFGVMIDPVITKTGRSYERASIMEHLSRHPTDPLTREPLLPSELRSNLGLKQACEEFLDANGWAVDW